MGVNVHMQHWRVFSHCKGLDPVKWLLNKMCPFSETYSSLETDIQSQYNPNPRILNISPLRLLVERERSGPLTVQCI